jgi:hypothetical protein
MAPGKSLIGARVHDYTSNPSSNVPTVAGAVVTATSLIHPDTPYTVHYTNNGTVIDPSATATDSSGFYVIQDVDAGDYVTVTTVKSGMGFQNRVFNTHAGAISSGGISGATMPPATTASPAGGAYSSTQNVTLSNTDPYADIFYTTDGSDPTIFGKPYSDAIPVSSTTTLRYYAQNHTVGLARAANQSTTYTIATPPVVSGFLPNGGVPGTRVTIYGSNFDGITPVNNIVHFPGTSTAATIVNATTSQLVVTVPGDATSTSGAISVTVAGQTGTSAGQFTVTPSTTLSGAVKMPGAGSISGVTIEWYNNSQLASTTSDGSGNFTLNGVPQGANFTVRASKSGYNDGYHDFWINGTSSGNVITIYDNSTYTSLGNQSGTGIIRAKVMNSNGDTSLAGATVSATINSVPTAVVYGSSSLSGSPPDQAALSTPSSGVFYIKNLPATYPNVQMTVALTGYSFQTPFYASNYAADSVIQVDIYDQTPNHNLSAYFNQAETGAGTVTSNPQNNGSVSCRPDSLANCNTTFTNGKLVTLTPVADDGSMFSVWTGCDSVISNICTVTMWNNKIVTATFNTDTSLPVHLSGTNMYRSSLQTIYDYYAANSGILAQGTYIQLKSGQLDGDFTAASNVSIKIKGGYDTDFNSPNNSVTTLHGVTTPIRIRQGKIVAEKVSVK